MSRFLALIMTLTALVMALACAPTVNVEEARAALIAADTDWSKTTKEPDKFVAFFAEGASIYAPGMPIVTGTEAIRKCPTRK